jgi:cytochrome c-type protein NapC
MRDNVFQEYKQTIHYSNRSGVRVGCADCHVPKSFGDKIIRKLKASKEVYGSIIGVIDTKEKFANKRHEMAVNVWRRMKTTDSLECRNCHNIEAMSEDEQSKRAWKRHQKGLKKGKTCIDCHFGIAHEEPEGLGPQEIDFSS